LVNAVVFVFSSCRKAPVTENLAAAIENTRPVMQLEKVKVGSVVYMVPTPITEHRFKGFFL
jgi:ribosomal protein S7